MSLKLQRIQDAFTNGTCTHIGQPMGCHQYFGFVDPLIVSEEGKLDVWCWNCWRKYRIEELEKQIDQVEKNLIAVLEYVKGIAR